MAEKITKKEMILEAALTLFAEKGYDGVGVDEIAASVGMRGPALYHYFKGKEAILDALIEATSEHYNANFGSADRIQHYPESLEELMAVSLKRLQFTIHDPRIKKVRRLYNMEQFRNDSLGKLCSLHQLDAVAAMNQIFLEKLIEKGKVAPYDSKLLAFELTAPVSILIQRMDREPDQEEELWECIQQHLNHFVEVYGR